MITTTSFTEDLVRQEIERLKPQISEARDKLHLLEERLKIAELTLRDWAFDSSPSVAVD